MSFFKRCSQCNKILLEKPKKLYIGGAEGASFCSKCKERLEIELNKKIREQTLKNKKEFKEKIKGLNRIVLPKTKMRLNLRGYEIKGSYNIEVYCKGKINQDEKIEIIKWVSHSLLEQFVGGLMGESIINKKEKVFWRIIDFESELLDKKFEGEEITETLLENNKLIIVRK